MLQRSAAPDQFCHGNPAAHQYSKPQSRTTRGCGVLQHCTDARDQQHRLQPSCAAAATNEEPQHERFLWTTVLLRTSCLKRLHRTGPCKVLQRSAAPDQFCHGNPAAHQYSKPQSRTTRGCGVLQHCTDARDQQHRLQPSCADSTWTCCCYK